MTQRSSIVFAVLSVAAALHWCVATQGNEAKGGKKLNLKSSYFDKPILLRGRTVSLAIELDNRGGGKGTISLDPNIRDEKTRTSTRMGFHPVDVTLNVVKGENAEKKGRKLYKISAEKLKLDQLLLVIPTEANTPCWLVIAGKGAVEDIIVMREKE